MEDWSLIGGQSFGDLFQESLKSLGKVGFCFCLGVWLSGSRYERFCSCRVGPAEGFKSQAFSIQFCWQLMFAI
jgi:hypothetical protein